MGETPRYYIAIVRPANLDRLVEAGLSFYAISSRKTKTTIKPGDRIILYKSRDRAQTSSFGIVGAFEVTGEPQLANRGILHLIFPVRIPWRPIATSLVNPLPIARLVPELRIFPNKNNYGSALQGSMKNLPPEDYRLIETALRSHISAVS